VLCLFAIRILIESFFLFSILVPMCLCTTPTSTSTYFIGSNKKFCWKRNQEFYITWLPVCHSITFQDNLQWGWHPG
jgi:hypothetical protein